MMSSTTEIPSAQPAARLPKRERLHHKKPVEELFSGGQSFIAYPLRAVYLLEPMEVEARSRILVSVPKKHFRRATKRNRIKRLMREAYRLNKTPWLKWLESKGLYARIAWSMVSKELPEYKQIEQAILKTFAKIQKREEEQHEVD
ncbi:MAG: ribonuclease P protein component [Porphyromonadaceae bacterium]|nr:ribonuclease P protein component [Porphyromonadaceae bacterium]